MKTQELKNIAMGGILLLLLSTGSYAQTQYPGNWEGIFMNDFKTKVKLISDENDGFSGSIEMYSGDTQIQNDRLSKVIFTGNQLTFYIESKQTEFKGEFNSEMNVLKGEFIFPDNTIHPITLSKNNLKTNELKNDSITTYYELKNKTFTVDELKNDFYYLVEKLVEFHPKLYAYTSKKEYDKLISETAENIDKELTIAEFFKLIAPVVERIKCSHTGIRLPQTFQEKLLVNANFFPLKLLFEKEKVFCLNNPVSNSEKLSGSEILSINHIPIHNIKQTLYSFIPSEGKNTTTKNYYLNQNFNSLFNLIDNSPVFEIEYKNHNSIHTASLKACKYSELQNNQCRVENEKSLSFIFDEKRRLGFLTVKSFMFPDISEYIHDMDAIFYQLHKENAKQLVIDLRGNSGGHPIFAAQLLSYLTSEEFTYFKRNDDVKEFEPLYNQMMPNKLQFKGDIYVFVDGGCLSTTGHLISLIENYTNATFIGEEPGSTFQCNDFSTKETLPNTGIEVNIPKTTFETAIDESEKMVPFTVNYQVNSSIEDYLNGDDSYIKCVNNLVF